MCWQMKLCETWMIDKEIKFKTEIICIVLFAGYVKIGYVEHINILCFENVIFKTWIESNFILKIEYDWTGNVSVTWE